jgi:hypothetical protein
LLLQEEGTKKFRNIESSKSSGAPQIGNNFAFAWLLDLS